MKKTYNTIKSFSIYSSRFINANFRIKLYGLVDGIKKNTLLGVSGALALLGERLYKYIAKMEACGDDSRRFSVTNSKGDFAITLYVK